MTMEENQKTIAKKSKLKLIVVIVFCIVICILPFALGLSYTPSFTAQIVDKNGKPLPGTYILYDYQGWIYGIVEGSHYYRNPSIVMTDKNGQFTIPALVHRHRPFGESRAKVHIEVGYSSVAHCVFYGTDFLKDWHDEEPNVHVVTLPDNTNDPKAWADSLYHLKFALSCVDDIYLVSSYQNSIQKIQEDFAAMIQSEQKLLNQTKK